MSKTTWLLERKIQYGFETLEYFGTLTDAKALAERNYPTDTAVSILKLVGDRFGEGYHDYRLALKHGRWVKVNTRTGDPLYKS